MGYLLKDKDDMRLKLLQINICLSENLILVDLNMINIIYGPIYNASVLYTSMY